MPEIIEILQLQAVDAPFFVADNTVFSKSLTFAGTKKLYNSNGKAIFSAGDNILLLSVGIVLPESFTFWKDPAAITNTVPRFELDIRTISGGTYNISNLNASGTIFVPMENYETPLDIFIDIAKQGITENFSLNSNAIADAEISTKAAPATFNGKTFFVAPFIKILHNFQMT